MTAEQVEAFKARIEPYLEKEADKAELADICRDAAAHVMHVEAAVDALIKTDVERWMR